MNENTFCLSHGLLVILLTATPLMAGATENSTYSEIDGVYFSDPSVDCDELKNSEVCELFKANEFYSLRDGISYSDCTVECDDMHESESCFSFRDTYPCPGESALLVVTLNALKTK